MARKTGITTSTRERLKFGAGKLYVAGRDVGATTGPTKFKVTRRWRWPELHGDAGDLAGTGFLVGEEAKLTMKLSEWQMANLALAIHGLPYTSNPLSETVTAGTIACPSAEHEVLWVMEDCDGMRVILSFYNALSEDAFAVSFRDDADAPFEVTLTTLYDTGDPDARPWQMAIIPDDCWTVGLSTIEGSDIICS